MPFAIETWNAAHRAALAPMIKAFLQTGVERGGDVLATDRNVEWLFNVGLVLSMYGDPCLVATHHDEVVAYIEWGDPFLGAAPFDQRWRTCHTFGAFTLPNYRHSGVSDTLRQNALARVRDRGYERIIGPVHLTNERGLQYFMAQGAWPTAVQMERLL